MYRAEVARYELLAMKEQSSNECKNSNEETKYVKDIGQQNLWKNILQEFNENNTNIKFKSFIQELMSGVHWYFLYTAEQGIEIFDESNTQRYEEEKLQNNSEIDDCKLYLQRERVAKIGIRIKEELKDLVEIKDKLIKDVDEISKIIEEELMQKISPNSASSFISSAEKVTNFII
jgi:hypothetical protein